MRNSHYLLAIALLGAPACFAGVVFDTGTGNTTTPTFAPDQGLGQPILVSSDTVLTQLGFYTNLLDGGHLNFLIFDSTNSNLLFSISEAVPASDTPSLILSPSFSFQLTGGTTYHFGFVTDSRFGLDYFFPGISFSQDGFSFAGTNDVYNGYPDATFLRTGNADVALQLDGAVAAPEPGSGFPLLLTLLAGIAHGIHVFLTRGCAVAEKEGGSFPWSQGPGFHLFCVPHLPSFAFWRGLPSPQRSRPAPFNSMQESAGAVGFSVEVAKHRAKCGASSWR